MPAHGALRGGARGGRGGARKRAPEKTALCTCRRCLTAQPGGCVIPVRQRDAHRKQEHEEAIRRRIRANQPAAASTSTSTQPLWSPDDTMDVDGPPSPPGSFSGEHEHEVAVPRPRFYPGPSVAEEEDKEPQLLAQLLPIHLAALCLGPGEPDEDGNACEPPVTAHRRTPSPSPPTPPPPTPPPPTPPRGHSPTAQHVPTPPDPSARSTPSLARTRDGGVDYLKHPELLKLPRKPPQDHPIPDAPVYEPFRKPLDQVYMDSHDNGLVRCFFALIATLRTKFNIALAPLTYILVVVHTVFASLGQLAFNVAKPKLHQFKQARTVLGRMSLDMEPTIYPVCPECHHIGPHDAPDDYECPRCNIPLFEPVSRFSALSGGRKRPIRQWPYIPLSRLLAIMLSDDELQEQIERSSAAPHTPGEYRHTLDGEIMRELRGHDGKPFFGPRDDHELRIGVSMALDGFSPFSSTYRETYSVTAVSFAIANLVFAIRYKYMLVPTLIPGPNEPTCQQLQNYLALIVLDLLMLFEKGILVYSKKYPDGRLVRVALVLVICDHPAMCHVCGFADKMHNNAPCTKCKIAQDSIRTLAGVSGDFEMRDGAEHRRLALEWLESSDRQKFYKKNGVQWFELARLPYFDPVRMTVVGPMHCFLNGLVKNNWYNVWIKTKVLRPNTDAGTLRELDVIHRMLRDLEVAPWLGRLPKLLGDPAGGSLKADQWMNLSTVVGPMALPVVWHETQPAVTEELNVTRARFTKAVEDHAQTREKYITKLAKHAENQDVASAPASSRSNKRKRPERPAFSTIQGWDDANPAPTEPVLSPRRVPAEMPMWLSLSTAMLLVMSRSLSDSHVQRGEEALREHLFRFVEIYGEEFLTYNDHWSLHIPAQIPDCGPVYGCWEFPGERVNKTLKNINTNNRRGGEMEVTMLREYQQKMVLDLVLHHAKRQTTNDVERKVLAFLTGSTTAARGTVESVIASVPGADELLRDVQDVETEEVAEADTGDLIQSMSVPFCTPHVQVASDAKAVQLNIQQQAALVQHYVLLGIKMHMQYDTRAHDADSTALHSDAYRHASILLDGRRITPSSATGGVSSSSALIKIHTSTYTTHGELLDILTHSRGGAKRTYGLVRTFRPCPAAFLPIATDFRIDFPELDVQYWLADEHEKLRIIPIYDIACQVARITYRPPDSSAARLSDNGSLAPRHDPAEALAHQAVLDKFLGVLPKSSSRGTITSLARSTLQHIALDFNLTRSTSDDIRGDGGANLGEPGPLVTLLPSLTLPSRLTVDSSSAQAPNSKSCCSDLRVKFVMRSPQTRRAMQDPSASTSRPSTRSPEAVPFVLAA